MPMTVTTAFCTSRADSKNRAPFKDDCHIPIIYTVKSANVLDNNRTMPFKIRNDLFVAQNNV